MAIMAVGNTRIMPGRATLVAGAQRTSQPPRAADIGQNLLKDSTRELKAFAKFSARRFACEADAPLS